jgi:hypothetical protein
MPVMWNRLTVSRPLLGALVLGGVLTSAAGCVDNTVSLYIRQVQAPLVAGAVCMVTPDPFALSIPSGTLDVALKNNYTMTPLIANQLVTRASMDLLRAETSTVNIQGFVVELREGSPDGPLVGPAFSVYQNVVVPAALTATTPGYAWANIQVIPPQVGDALRGAVCQIDRTGVNESCPVYRVVSASRTILVKLTAFGASLGGNDVESSPFYFPVTVCCGCLITFPVDADAPATMTTGIGRDCNNGMPLIGPASCNLGQDFPVDCRYCSTAHPEFCQPRGFSPNGSTCAP